MHRSLQEDDEGRARTTAHAHPVLRHVEAARQPARQLQTTQQNPCLAFGKGFFQLFSGAAGRQQTFKKKVALHGKPDPGPPRGGAGGPVVPAASSRDLRGGVQRRTEVVRARGVQARGLEDWKGLTLQVQASTLKQHIVKAATANSQQHTVDSNQQKTMDKVISRTNTTH